MRLQGSACDEIEFVALSLQISGSFLEFISLRHHRHRWLDRPLPAKRVRHTNTHMHTLSNVTTNMLGWPFPCFWLTFCRSLRDTTALPYPWWWYCRAGTSETPFSSPEKKNWRQNGGAHGSFRVLLHYFSGCHTLEADSESIYINDFTAATLTVPSVFVVGR